MPAVDVKIDGHSPGAVVTPGSDEELCSALRAANDEGRAVVAVGGGTLQAIGERPRRYDVALATARLDRVFAYDNRDLTIGVGAGLTVNKFAAVLAKNRQFVPLDAPRATRATVGGTLAAGWLGPRRSTYGRPRDLVIGTTVALADGTLGHAGGMVVKNVTGYDLSKLYVGSLGTLGVIARANFKTLPLPAAFRFAVAPLPEGSKTRAVAHLQSLEVEPTAALLVQGFREILPFEEGADGAVALVFEGSTVAVERATRNLRSALGAAGVPETRIQDAGGPEAFARLIDAYVATIAGRSVTLRALGLPESALTREFAAREALTPTATFLDTIVDLRSGDLIARVFVDGSLAAPAIRGTLSDAVAALRERIPQATILARGVVLDGEIEAWGAPPSALETMRALKARFDPRGTLAPGRFVGGI
ncbi:MAG: FAD-binding oxidoreductase [Candidatus Eremiobacteraeota bacterium]|nr:FAD-binding oxidoreductase [Candidatus Eremiobacteraeota bacterium]